MEDLRPAFFAGLEWYESLKPPTDDEPTAWWLARSEEPHPRVDMLNACLAFAVEHDLFDVYRMHFKAILPKDLLHQTAKREHRTCTFPIMQVANELLVARYLERVFGWRFDKHAPPGDRDHLGDWQFVTPQDRVVFIEVKSIQESELTGGVYTVNFTPKLSRVVASAYAQLPLDGRAVLVALVSGRLTLDMPTRNPLLGFLFGALFGQYQVTFEVMPFDERTVRAGPSFRDMTVHGTKNRRIGCVAAFRPGGMDTPSFGFYAIHNPYAHEEVKVDPKEFGGAFQFVVNAEGRGAWMGECYPDDVWDKMR